VTLGRGPCLASARYIGADDWRCKPPLRLGVVVLAAHGRAVPRQSRVCQVPTAVNHPAAADGTPQLAILMPATAQCSARGDETTLHFLGRTRNRRLRHRQEQKRKEDVRWRENDVVQRQQHPQQPNHHIRAQPRPNRATSPSFAVAELSQRSAPPWPVHSSGRTAQQLPIHAFSLHGSTLE